MRTDPSHDHDLSLPFLVPRKRIVRQTSPTLAALGTRDEQRLAGPDGDAQLRLDLDATAT